MCFRCRIWLSQTGATVQDHGSGWENLQPSGSGTDPQTTVKKHILQTVCMQGFCGPHRLIVWCDFRQEIDKLRKEQEELHRNLDICKNFSHLHRDNEDTKSLCALLDEEDMTDASLIKEKEHQQVLDKEVNHTLRWQLLTTCLRRLFLLLS